MSKRGIPYVILLIFVTVIGVTNTQILVRCVTPFFVALVLKIAFEPIFAWIKSPVLWLLSLTIFLGLTGAVLGVVLIPKIVEDVREISRLMPEYLELLRGVPFFDKIKDTLFAQLEAGINASISLAGEMMAVFSQGVVTTIILYYYIASWKDLKRHIMQSTPQEWHEMLGKIWLITVDFVHGRVVLALVWGVVTSLLLMVLGVRFALILGFGAAILNMVPFVGPIFALAPLLVAVALVEPLNIVWLVGAFLIIEAGEFMYRRRNPPPVPLHPLFNVLAVLMGGEVAGLWGMLLFSPLFSIGKAILQTLFESRPRQ